MFRFLRIIICTWHGIMLMAIIFTFEITLYIIISNVYDNVRDADKANPYELT